MSRTSSVPGKPYQGPGDILIIVQPRQDPTDARSFRLYLTERGRTFECPVARCWAQTEEKAFAGLGAGERETFRKSLIRVRSNLDPGFRAE